MMRGEISHDFSSKGANFSLFLGYDQIKKEAIEIARENDNVLILGETGVGKTLIAKCIHNASNRSNGKYTIIDCPAISASVFESELFGHSKGSFTDAKTNRAGLIEEADGGTALFDEIGDIPYELQAKLLLTAEHKTYRRVGGNTSRIANVRFIFATNRDLRAMVNNHTFRKDLFYRIAKRVIYIPPLREMREALPLIANSIWNKHERHGKLTNKEMDILLDYSFPGNIRELETILGKHHLTWRMNPQKSREWSLKKEITELKETEYTSYKDIKPTQDISSNNYRSYEVYCLMAKEGKGFWDVVYKPYLNRLLNKFQLIEILKLCLNDAIRYRRKIVEVINVDKNEHKKFLDFIGHQGIKLSKLEANTNHDPEKATIE